MNILQTLLEKFPIRRTDAQKQAFQSFVLEHCKEQGIGAKVEELDKNQNIIIGDPLTAKVILTAHYDTPASSLFPNLMMPHNKVLSLLYHFSYPILLALVALAVSYGLAALAGSRDVLIPLYLVLYLGSFYLLTRTFVNPHNANDNTSGVATVLTLATKLAPTLAEKGVACILFDNEEKGLKGSKAFSKAYKAQISDTLVVNFDCVGDGENILFVAKPKAAQNPHFIAIREVLSKREEKTAVFYSSKQASCNSDQKNFETSVAVVACHKYPVVGYATGKIHTRRDTACDPTNIDYLVSAVLSSL